MAKKILISYDFGGNEIQNALLHVLAAAPTALGAGQVYYDSVIGRPRWYDGATWRNLDYINDATTTTTNLWSADKISTEIAAAVAGGVNYKGGYNASTNTPDLDTAPSGIDKGFMYTVTAAGTFFTEPLAIGDVLIAEIDNPTTLADWTIVERNLTSATETSEGTTEIATQAEADAGADDFRYITPLKLKTYLTNLNVPHKFAVDLDGAGEASVVRVFAGGVTTWTVTHNLNTLDTNVQVKEISTGEEVVTDVINTGVNVLQIKVAGSKADDVYRVTIVG